MTVSLTVECCYAVSFTLTALYAECHKLALYDECHYSERHKAKCHDDERLGPNVTVRVYFYTCLNELPT
jgi:hypothetical protein